MGKRNNGLGGTDIAAVVGLNPWKSPIDVYMEKTGLVEPIPDTENLYWGRELEPAVLRRYAKETGLPVFPNSELMVGNEDWIIGTPDALVEPKGGVDAKTTGRPDDWADGPPDYVACQAHWYAGITGASWWDIALLILSPRRAFKIFRIERDQEVIDRLVEAGRDFWFNHVLLQVPPPLDGSAGSSEYLKQTYPRDVQDIIVASPMAESLMMALQGNKQAMKEIEGETAELENRLKEIIGDNAGILGRDWRATWKKSKDRSVVDWEKVVSEVANRYYNVWFRTVIPGDFNDEIMAIQKTFTTIKPGPRVFRVTALKEGK